MSAPAHWVRHGACGLFHPPGHTFGHCGGCHRTFKGASAFEGHQRMINGRSLCLSPVDLPDYWEDDHGIWHRGAKLTQEQRDELFRAAS